MHNYNFSEENISRLELSNFIIVALLIVHDWCIVLLIDYLVMHTFSKIQF